MATSTFVPTICQDNTAAINNGRSNKPREKRVHLHHHHSVPHIRPMQRPNDNRQRKLRAKQRPNNILISTDGTTSGDDGSETKNKQELEVASKLDQMLRPSNNSELGSELEADCEDNNYTDVDTVSLSGTYESAVSEQTNQKEKSTVQLLHSKIIELEKQLANVIQKNLKLTEENNKLKQMIVSK